MSRIKISETVRSQHAKYYPVAVRVSEMRLLKLPILYLTRLGTSLKQIGAGAAPHDDCIFQPYELFLDIETTCRAEMKPVAWRFVLFPDQFVRECKPAAGR